MIKKHVHFDGLLKPEILDKLKILKGAGLGLLHCDGMQISFNPGIQPLLGTKIHDCTTHGNNILGIGYSLDNQKKCNWMCIHPFWKEYYVTGDCNTFQIDILDMLPPKYIRSGQNTCINWHIDKIYARTIEHVGFYGTNRSGEATKLAQIPTGTTDVAFTYDVKTIEFIVFTFTNGLKFFMAHKWFGQAVVYFDLDISIAEFIEKKGYEKDRDEGGKWKIVLQHEI